MLPPDPTGNVLMYEDVKALLERHAQRRPGDTPPAPSGG
jgi:hypothetical protein